MKKSVAIFLALVMVFALAACAGNTEPTENSGNTGSSQNTEDPFMTPSEAENESDVPGKAQSEPAESKILVAYFSVTGNTEGVAQKLANGLGADLYEITPSEPYIDADLDYGNSKSRSSVEMNNPEARPAISGTVANMAQYDVVLLGYPIWWGEAPRIMSTFIESYDFSGKTLAAFCTSASSGFGSSDKALRSAATGAKWLTGHRFSAGASADDIAAWLKSNQISVR